MQAAELQALKTAGHSSHAEAHPNGKGIERTGVGIVALARLIGRLVQVDDNGYASHEEKEEHHPELLDAFLAAESLPEKSAKAEYERQTVEDVVSFVVLELIGQRLLIS